MHVTAQLAQVAQCSQCHSGLLSIQTELKGIPKGGVLIVADTMSSQHAHI